MEISLQTAKESIIQCFKHKLVPIVTGQPGVGKSELIYSIAKEFKLKVIDVRLAQCEPSDLLGIPFKEDNKTSYVPFDTFPLETDTVPKGYKGWLLFLDEIRNADVQVQNAAYKLILDRMVGHHHLHEKCFIVAAGNREEDNTFVTPMPSALKSRMIHLNIRLDFGEWMNWAAHNNIDTRITSFINFKPSFLATSHTDSKDETYACPRSWNFANKLINGVEDINTPTYKALMHGTVGSSAATEFMSFIKYFSELPKYQDILDDYTKAKRPDENNPNFLGLVWATLGMLEDNFTEEHLDKVLNYCDLFMPKDFLLVMLRNLVTKKKLSVDTLLSDRMRPYVKALQNVITA